MWKKLQLSGLAVDSSFKSSGAGLFISNNANEAEVCATPLVQTLPKGVWGLTDGLEDSDGVGERIGG